MPNQWRRPLIGALAIYVVAASVFLVTGRGGSQDQLEPKNTGQTFNQGLYSLEFTTLDGVKTSFADYAGAPLIVNFFASWCTPCVKEMPDFQQLYERHGERFQILGLAVEGQRPARQIVELTGVTYPVGLDDSDLLVELGGVAMPTTVFISKQGELLESHSGVLTYSNLISRTEKLLVMNDVNLAFAFTAGIVATINPCGFAMLPAYLSYFLGIEANSDGTRGASIARALTTGSTVSLGFLMVFGVAGVLISAGLTAIREVIPWVAVAVGLALVILGTAVTAGKRIDLAMPKFQRGTGSKDLRSLLLFGVSYAVASISCGLPTFIVVVSTSVNGFRSGLLAFLTYALGMAITLLSLTVSLALARSSFLEKLRSLVRFVDRASGLLMVLAGIYLVMYWLTERAGSRTNWFIDAIENWSANLSNTITDLGGVRTGVLLSVVLALGLIVWLIQFEPASSDSSPERL